MTTKQRAYLKGLAMTMDPILQLGIQEGDTVRMYGFDFDYYK